ncbi:glycosyltransferase [Methylosinus sp. LW4]|uniref:glycosyltransferase n=1 Tax=Methylosinus sp. LW4 TaxID=136993 RepID=UPI0005B9BA1E|nr:glycosyltransferase [Methylosinus sp. LW4]
MKILIDLQCCQTEAQSRGMGRYSLSLAKEIVRIGREHDFMFLLNRHYLDKSADLISEIAKIDDLGNVILHDYPSVQYDWRERQRREQVANVLRNDRIETVSPDVYHISSVFEGESVYGAAAAFIDFPKPPIIRSATLYDFIPLLYPDKYLTDWQVALWYKRTSSLVPQLDVGLAISDATKKDAERLFHLKPERVVNIFGSVADHFRILSASEAHRGAIWRRFAPGQKFILYVGGPDFRKNLDGTLEAFAIANKELADKYKLLIVYDIKNAEALALREKAARLGVAPLVVTTGFVSDDELVELYNAASLFVFPPLYEGLGLPVIEAMRCGAPVLVGDNSSLTEIVDDPAYRFDAEKPADMAKSMVRALTKEGELQRMRAYSRERAALFTWEKSARRALDAWEETFAARSGRKAPSVAGRAPRIAMFTPLPLAKTGVADYSAEFLPALSKFASFEIFVDDVAEVETNFDDMPIWHHSQFPFKAHLYDAIVYQLGNSPFHHYMLPYIESFPGVVVIHDAYLGYLSYDPGNPDAFIRRMIQEHGGPARAIVLAGEGGDRTARSLVDALPCSATATHRSLGVIVHSRFAHDVLVAASRRAAAPKIVVLPQYRAGAARESAPSRAEAREALAIPPEALVIISLGHVAHTKGVLELIEGFKRSIAGRSGDARLLLVGELEGGVNHDSPYAREVLRAIGGRSDIQITGYVEKEIYDLYIVAADIGVQLRTMTRGETSGAILNLLMNGAPFIYNRMGPSAELPAQVAVALDTYQPESVVEALDALAGGPALRQAYGKAALRYCEEVLNPEKIAEKFVRSVVAMTEHAETCGPKKVSKTIARLLRDAPITQEFVQEIARSYVRQERSELAPRLLIDVTHIREGDLKTGVQRVVREITRAAYTWDDARLRPQAFAYTEAGLIYADDYAQSCGARAPVEVEDVRFGVLDLRPFDKILMADGTWHLADWMREPIDRLDQIGGAAFGLVHDILPLQHPDLFLDHVKISVTNWLTLLLEKGAGLICTSQSGADGLIEWVEGSGITPRPGLRIGYARLGADFASKAQASAPVKAVTADLADRENLFLMVGTIEPRKGHDYVLDAFERLWASGVDATLVFVGKAGWSVDELLRRFDSHDEKGKRFFYLGFMPEADVARLYQSATATIVASIAEGFGLPIYEAAHFGSPLLLSDLPVFAELGGEHARYFSAGSASHLAAAVREQLASGPIPSKGIAMPSWNDCARRIFEFLDGEHTYRQF